MYNHTLFERAFDQTTIASVWRKGRVIDGYDPSVYRRDMCGSAMRFSDYGKQTDYGWEVDHIRPVSRNGSDDLSNLQPLHWQNNRRKGDAYPWSCT